MPPGTMCRAALFLYILKLSAQQFCGFVAGAIAECEGGKEAGSIGVVFDVVTLGTHEVEIKCGCVDG